MLKRLSTFLQNRRVDFGTFGTVFDIGSRDGLQAIELSQLFPNSNVIAVECNSATLETCRRNISGHPRIRLVDKAINSFTGRCPFYPIDPARTVTTWADGNPGASSLFVATGDYPAEQYVQNKTEVECTRLDDLCRELHIDVIDLIWMDLQGAELLALDSAGRLLDRVRYIYTEVSHRSIYEGQCLFDDVDAFLTARGFRLCTKINRDRWQQDLIYENTRPLIDVFISTNGQDTELLDLTVQSVRKFVANVRNIYVTCACNPVDGTRYLDPASFPFDMKAITAALGSNANAPAYFRQIAKLYMPLVCRGALEHVLAIDANTIFLRPCNFIQNGRPLFNFGDEDDGGAFAHMARLYPVLRRMFAYSATSGCMVLKRQWLNELRNAVEGHHDGKPLWQAYLEAIDASAFSLAASEAEIYFNFALMFHCGELIIHRFRWAEVSSVGEEQLRHADYIVLGQSSRMAPDERASLQAAILGDVIPSHSSSNGRLAGSIPVARHV